MKETTKKTIFTIIRVILGVVFVLSGFVKSVDPRGVGYKVAEYFNIVGFKEPSWINLSLIAGGCLAIFEFVLGVHLLLGIRRRFTSYVTLLLCVAFLAVSILTAIFHPIPDCGCFGDFYKLSQTETVLKNILLSAFSVFLVLKPRLSVSFVAVGWHWFVSLYSWVYITLLMLGSMYYLPPMDFRPYKISADLRESVFPSDEKNLEKDNFIPLDLYISDSLKNDMTAEILSDKGKTMLVVCPLLREADIAATEQINTIADWCYDNNIKIYCLTSSSIEETQEWSKMNDIQYPILFGDLSTLRTIIRSNPGLVLLSDGVIVNKWSCHNLPRVDSRKFKPSQLFADPANKYARLLMIVSWYIFPMLLIIFLSHSITALRKHIYKPKKSLDVKL